MKATFSTSHRELAVDMSRPMPISIRLRDGGDNPVAWYADYPEMKAVRMDGFVGSVAEGGSVNTRDIRFNPHGNGTHTECIGHLTKEAHEVDEYMRDFIMLAHVISVTPEVLESDEGEFRKKGDLVITQDLLDGLSTKQDITALIIRTLPNTEGKLKMEWSGNNPPYVDEETMSRIRQMGMQHLLIDLPSVDRESDGGKMLAHKAFWFDGNEARIHSTITEMVYVPNTIRDGEYLLNIMVAPFGNDASPSKPVLYPILR